MQILVAVVVCASVPFSAQSEPSEAAKAMQRLSFLEGRWEGTGTMSLGPGQKADAKVVEVGQFKLQKSVFMLEGTGQAEMPDGSKRNVHDALGLISYDTKAEAFRLRTYRAGGEVLDPTIKVDDRKIVWSFKDPVRGNQIRFTLKVEGDRWTEVGEVMTAPGQWFAFFEMNLKRVSTK